MRKILSLVLVLSMVLGSFGFAFAAPADVEGTDYEDAVIRLSALEVLAGFPDGTFRPEETVTRAQFAKIMANALGVGSAAQYAAGATKFADVPADHWATGYINVVSDMKVINGYGDGNFGPEDQVTYAQAVTMIVRALGYEPKATAMGGYPGGYLAVAAEQEITDDINFVNTLAATRGDVALMVDNSLTVPMMVQKTWGQYPEYEEDEDKTLMKTKLGVDEISGQVTQVPKTDSNIEENEIKITNDDGTDKYDMLVDGVNFDALLGLDVTVWVDGDDILDFDIDTDEDDMMFDSVVAADKTEVELFVDGEVYDWADDAVVYENFDKVDPKDISNDAYGYFVFDDDEVIFANVFNFSLAKDLVTEVDGDEINVNGSGDLDLADYEDGIHAYDKNFNAIDISDVAVDSVIYSWSASDELYIVVVNDKVSGELDKAKDSKLYIDGEDYLTASGATYTVDNDDAIDPIGSDADNLVDLVGETVEFVLDVHGDINHVRGDVLVTSDLMFGLFQDADSSNFAYQVKVFTQDGEEAVYEFASSSDYTADYNSADDSNPATTTDEKHVKDMSANELVAFKLDKDGKIASKDFYVLDPNTSKLENRDSVDLTTSYDEVSTSATGDYYFNDSDDTIEDLTGSTVNARYYVEEDTVLFNVDADSDPELVKFEEIEDITSIIAMSHILKEDKGNDLSVVVFTAIETQSTDTEYAVVTEKPWLTSDGWKIELNVFDSGVKEYIIEDNASNYEDSLSEGQVIDFTLNGDDEIKTATIYSGSKTVTATDGRYIKTDGAWEKIDSDAVIYLLDEDALIEKTLEYDDIDVNDDVIYKTDSDDRIVALTVLTDPSPAAGGPSNADYELVDMILVDADTDDFDNDIQVTFNVTNPEAGKDYVVELLKSDVHVAYETVSAASVASDNTEVVVFAASDKTTGEYKAVVFKTDAHDAKLAEVSKFFVIDPLVGEAGDVLAAKAALDLGDLSAVTSDLTLSTTGANGTTISWASDTPARIATNGTVSQDAADNTDDDVVLTATITKGDANDTKVFNATVLEGKAPAVSVGATDTAVKLVLDIDEDAATVTLDAQNITDQGGSEAATLSFDAGVDADLITIDVAGAGASNNDTVTFTVTDAAGNATTYVATWDTANWNPVAQ